MTKVIYKIFIIVAAVSLIASVSTQYIKMSFDFNIQETATYNDLFFNTDNFEYNIYGIGSSDIYTDRQIEIEKKLVEI